MACPKCSAENPGHARFCGKCGHTLASQANPGPAPGDGKTAHFFKWVGYIFTGLIVLGILANL